MRGEHSGLAAGSARAPSGGRLGALGAGRGDGPGDAGPGRAREAPRPGRLRVGAEPVLPAALERRGCLAGRPARARRSCSVPVRDQAGAPRRPGAASAVRLQRLLRRVGDLAHPRKLGHDRASDAVRALARRLEPHRCRPRTDHVELRPESRRHALHRLVLQPLSRQLGSSRRCRGARRPRAAVRCRRSGADRAGARADRRCAADARSTGRPRMRCTWPAPPLRRASTRRRSVFG